MSRDGRCEHGHVLSVYRGYTGPMAAPASFCKCCRTHFYYIDSASYLVGPDGSTRGGGRSHTKDRCGECGGGYEEWGDL